MEMRKIIHVDMDAFYASVEQRDFPELRGKPVGVGGLSPRSVLCTASYEARVFGVRAALPTSTALRRCPELIVVPPRFDIYAAISREIREIFGEYTDLIEPLSLDEAFLDVTENKTGNPSATRIAEEIKKKIFEKTSLTASAGVSCNKFLAKIASGYRKPDGLTVIPPEKAAAFVEKLSIRDFFGIGKVTAERLEGMGILTGADLKSKTEVELKQIFGKSGSYYFNVSRGVDHRPVQVSRERKSIGAENTFQQDLKKIVEMEANLEKISEDVVERMKKTGKYGKTVTLKLKYDDFTVNTRSRTLHETIQETHELFKIVRELLHSPEAPSRAVRLLGVAVSKFDSPTSKSPETGSQLTFGESLS